MLGAIAREKTQDNHAPIKSRQNCRFYMKLIWTEAIGVARYSSASQGTWSLGADEDSITLSVRLNASLAVVVNQAPTCVLLRADDRVFGTGNSIHLLAGSNK